MDPTSDTPAVKELRRLLSKAEQENDILRLENDKLRQLHSRGEEELAIVSSSRDKFRRLFSEAEGKMLEQKLAFLDLENDYEREKTKRINAEKVVQASSRPSISSKRKATPDVIVVDDDSVVTENHSINNNKAAGTATIPGESEQTGNSGSSKPTVPLSQPSKKPLPSEADFEDMYVIEDQDEPAPKRRKLGRLQEITSDLNENTGINIVSTASRAPSIEIMSTSSRPESIRTAIPRSTPRNHLPSVMSDTEDLFSPSPEPVDISMLNTPTKPKMKFNHSPKSPKIASSSTLPLPLIPIESKSGKKAEGGWSLPPSQIAKYLGSTKIFTISPPPVLVRVSRNALTEVYGLPGMGFLWVSKGKPNPLRIMMPTYEVNPEMPRAPGEPGILLSCREEMCKDGPWTLFVKVEGLKESRWDYAGEYISQVVGKMSKEDFQLQDAAVKQTWGEKIERHKKFPAYRSLRARITLRKAIGREPTDDEVAAEADRIKSRNYTSSLTCEDVIRAFERGEEFISVVKTECIAYHHARAKEYAAAENAYDAIAKVEDRFPVPERKRRREERTKKRTPPTAPVPYDASITPEKVAGASGIQEETPVSSSSVVRVSPQGRVVRLRKKSYKLIDQ